jgi:hypothetical protein
LDVAHDAYPVQDRKCRADLGLVKELRCFRDAAQKQWPLTGQFQRLTVDRESSLGRCPTN